MIARKAARFLARRLAPYGLPATNDAHTNISDRHVHNCRVLPDRRTLLENLPMDGVAAEIGVAEGDFSALILMTNRPKVLHLIDAWEHKRYRAARVEVERRFSEQIRNATIRIHSGLSTGILPSFDDHYFDWVYIDTDHSYDTTLAELDLCNRKVKLQGRIAGHDFSKGNPAKCLRYGVIDACHNFCVTKNWAYEFVTLDGNGDFSFCLKRL